MSKLTLRALKMAGNKEKSPVAVAILIRETMSEVTLRDVGMYAAFNLKPKRHERVNNALNSSNVSACGFRQFN
jgi:hypothetical protein